MFVFPQQKAVKIGNITLGGQPGEHPVVLIGTIFYDGHAILEEKGFDKKRAEELINLQTEKSEETNLPRITNVYGTSGGELIKRMEFVMDVDDAPIMLDSPSYRARAEAVEHARDTGTLDRVVYNSINITLNKEEKERLKNASLKNALVLAHTVNERGVEDKINCLENEGALSKGLIENAKEIGVKNILIDSATTPLRQGASTSISGILALKAKFGYPVGCGIHNAVSSWNWLRNRESKKFVDIASSIIPIVFGADFVLYGPIENARYIFDAAAFAEILVEENAERFLEHVHRLEL